MNSQPSATEAVVRNHLQCFLEQRGLAAILSDYEDDACFHSEARSYRGKEQIGQFFAGFLAALPPRAIERFSLRSLRVHGDMAYITWNVGAEIPLGTDTFVVRGGKIVAQTFAMCMQQPERSNPVPL